MFFFFLLYSAIIAVCAYMGFTEKAQIYLLGLVFVPAWIELFVKLFVTKSNPLPWQKKDK